MPAIIVGKSSRRTACIRGRVAVAAQYQQPALLIRAQFAERNLLAHKFPGIKLVSRPRSVATTDGTGAWIDNEILAIFALNRFVALSRRLGILAQIHRVVEFIPACLAVCQVNAPSDFGVIDSNLFNRFASFVKAIDMESGRLAFDATHIVLKPAFGVWHLTGRFRADKILTLCIPYSCNADPWIDGISNNLVTICHFISPQFATIQNPQPED